MCRISRRISAEMKFIAELIRRHIGIFLAAMLFLTIETLSDLMQPAFMAHVVDDGVKGRDIGLILYYGAVMLGIAAVGAVGAVMRNILASRTSQLIGKELRGELYRKIQTLSFENIDRLQPASIITRITNDVTQIQNFINGSMRIMMKAPIICIGAVILIIRQTPQQFPVMAAILCVSAGLIAANMKLGYPRFGRLQKKLDKLNDVSREFLSSIRVVKAFNAEEQEGEKAAHLRHVEIPHAQKRPERTGKLIQDAVVRVVAGIRRVLAHAAQDAERHAHAPDHQGFSVCLQLPEKNIHRNPTFLHGKNQGTAWMSFLL